MTDQLNKLLQESALNELSRGDEERKKKMQKLSDELTELLYNTYGPSEQILERLPQFSAIK